MSTNDAVISAAVGSLVAVGINLAVKQFQTTKEDKARKAELDEAVRESHIRGWYEGRESILQEQTNHVTRSTAFNN
jgi:hypothetical protein